MRSTGPRAQISCLKFDIQVIRLIRHDMTCANPASTSESVRRRNSRTAEAHVEPSRGCWGHAPGSGHMPRSGRLTFCPAPRPALADRRALSRSTSDNGGILDVGGRGPLPIVPLTERLDVARGARQCPGDCYTLIKYAPAESQSRWHHDDFLIST